MPTCNICIDELSGPVALPCGHVFCGTCLIRTINSIKPTTSMQPCPTCRSLYSIAYIDPSAIPDSIRPHVTPGIRKLFLEESGPSSPTPSPTPAAVSECERLSAENKNLRVNCAVWKRRAEFHAAATLGLLNLARMGRDYNKQLKAEKDELQRECNMLKRKLGAEEAFALSTAFGDQGDFPSPCRPGTPSSGTAVKAEPTEQYLPPSLKRRKTGCTSSPPHTLNPRKSAAELAPRRSTQKRKELCVS